MSARTRLPSLGQMMQQAIDSSKTQLANGNDDELRSIAMLRSVDGELVVVGLLGETTPQNVTAVRAMAIKERATAVVLRSEAWAANLSVDDPIAKRLLRREILVRDLPPEKRFDALIIYGEELGARRPQIQTFAITSGRTDLRRQRLSESEWRTAFWPLLLGNVR